MIKDECKQHVWKRIGSAGRQEDVGTLETPFRCENCPAEMTASEVFQLEALENQTKLAEHQLGFERWRSIIALILSGFALIISVLTFLYQFIWKK